MKAWLKVFICISLSFICLFTCVGYAAINSEVVVVGTGDIVLPKEVYITSVDTSGTLGGSAAVNSFVGTTINSHVQLGNDSTSTVTLHVSVFNNTIDYYSFEGVFYTEGEGTYDNANIKFNVTGINVDDRIAPGKFVDIDITFSYNRYAGAPEDLLSVINLHFHLSGEEDGTDYEQYILIFMNNDKGYGLNDEGKKSEAVYNLLKSGGILYADDHMTQGNLGQLLKALDTTDTKGLTFVYEFISDTEINLYTYERDYNSVSYNNQTITVYKTNFTRKSTGSETYDEWKPTNSRPTHGTATIKRITRDKGSLYAIDIGTWQATMVISE